MDVNFSLFSINIPDFLILRARKTSAPGAEVARDVLGPNQSGNLNFIMVGLDTVNHFFDLYESVDGSALNTLLGTFTYDVKNQKITNEERYYIVGSGANNSPDDQATSLTDSYLDGKTVSGFEKRSIGSLIPDRDDTSGYPTEWSIAGTTISLLNGLVFTAQELYVAKITYLTTVDTPQTSAFFKGIKNITEDTEMDATYRNNRIRCNGTGPRLTVTFEHDASIPNGSFWYFMDQNGGSQNQTKFLLQDGNFLYNGTNYSELWIGKGDCLWIEFNDGVFEVIKPSEVMENVGKHSAQMIDGYFLNMLPEDNRLLLGDDWPALWYFLTHAFPNANYYILDDNLDNVGYTRPTDVDGFPYKTGLFIISVTKRKFRMPDTQGYSEKGSKSFTTFGADTNRLYDYPGGFEKLQSPDHQHDTLTGKINTDPNGTGPSKSGGQYGDPRTGTTDLTSTVREHDGTADDRFGNDNIVNNFSVIYMRHT